jgi:hypothetical protein
MSYPYIHCSLAAIKEPSIHDINPISYPTALIEAITLVASGTGTTFLN